MTNALNFQFIVYVTCISDIKCISDSSRLEASNGHKRDRNYIGPIKYTFIYSWINVLGHED